MPGIAISKINEVINVPGYFELRIRFVSAPCGSGKTHQLINRACELARSEERVLVLQPTKELIDKTIHEELLPRPNPPPHFPFHGDIVPVGSSVAGAITDHFKNYHDSGGQIVFATHAVLPYVKYFANNQDWHVLVDEELQVLRYKSHRLPQTHPFLTDHLELDPHNSIYSCVHVEDDAALEDQAKNKDGDEILETLSDTSRILTNQHWETFVNTEQYEKLKAGRVKRLAFHSVLNPTVLEGFASVFIAAANFEDTAVYRLWQEKGVKFEQDQDFADTLRFESHSNGELVTIYYVTEKQWSKKLLKASVEPENENATTLDYIIQATKKLFGDSHFVWQANKSVPNNSFGNHVDRLPHKPHGLNDYSGINDIAFLSALNPPRDHFRFLDSQGLDGGDIRRCIYFSAAYQSVMRTSIRDPANQEPKRIVVPDRGLAEYLHALFPDSKIEKLDAGLVEDNATRRVGRRRKYATNADRVAAQRKKAKETKNRIIKEQLLLNSHHDASGTARCGLDKDQRSRAEKGIDIIPYLSTQPCCATLYPDKFSPRPVGYLTCSDVDSVVQFLHETHSFQRMSKENNILISPAVFDPDKVKGTNRGIGNIVYVQHLWLDFEDGDLQPEQFAALFPNIKMVITNSYRHTKDNPRFRALIPTSSQMTPEVYLIMYDNIVCKLEDAGYEVKKPGRKNRYRKANTRQSGLDRSKRAPSSLFYLPAQAQDTSQSFFTYYNESERVLLDPLLWVENGVAPVQPEPVHEPLPIDNDSPIDNDKVQLAIQTWRGSKALPGKGGERFWDLALAFKRAGMSQYDIESTLRYEAQFGRSPRERRNQIPSIISSLAKSKAKADLSHG